MSTPGPFGQDAETQATTDSSGREGCSGPRADNALWLTDDTDWIVPAPGRHAVDAGLEVSMTLSSEHVVARAPDLSSREGMRELYCSPNGDRWQLVRDAASVRVRHVANPASGGHVTETDIGTFLRGGGSGPEKQELLRLIGELAV